MHPTQKYALLQKRDPIIPGTQTVPPPGLYSVLAQGNESLVSPDLGMASSVVQISPHQLWQLKRSRKVKAELPPALKTCFKLSGFYRDVWEPQQ